MECKLAPELIEHIIDFHFHDKYTLSQCSLVAHNWLHESQYHLFNSIICSKQLRVHPEDVDIIVDELFQFFNSHPHLARLSTSLFHHLHSTIHSYHMFAMY
ncbi:hypothetical protein C8Q75DRAFT_7228 [Abortiporus biennis]|nr:hypothetical protein C8Q75DRAFT_7228 [Abortiporus biennis]